VLNNESELLNLLNREKYLIQKFIKGNEYTIDIYRSPKTGKILSIVPRQRLETQGGESIKSITIKNENIEAFAKEVILKTNLIGPITLQILENEEKELFFSTYKSISFFLDYQIFFLTERRLFQTALCLYRVSKRSHLMSS